MKDFNRKIFLFAKILIKRRNKRISIKLHLIQITPVECQF